MEHTVTKTLMLAGRALELAQAIDQTMSDTNDRIGELKAQADSLHKAAVAQAERLQGELKHELGLDEDACCHIDLDYLAEHGIAFAKTGCERPSGIGDLLGQLLGRKSPDAPSGAGLH